MKIRINMVAIRRSILFYQVLFYVVFFIEYLEAFSGKKTIIFLGNYIFFLFEAFSFKECQNSKLPDPKIPGVTDCLSWTASVQKQGVDLVKWCSNTDNYQKCCLTCRSIFEYFSFL